MFADEPPGRQIVDQLFADRGIEGEVKVLENTDLLEVSCSHPPCDADSVAACDLVLAQCLQELDIAELPGARLGEALSLEMAQPLPVARAVLHYRYGVPTLGRRPWAARALCRLNAMLERLIPRTLWAYTIVRVRRTG